MNKVLDWVKKNVIIVVLVVVMIVALIALPMYAKGQNAKVKSDVESRNSLLGQLKKLDKTSFENPVTGEIYQLAVNDALLKSYEEVVDSKRSDGEQVLDRALSFNKDGHELIVPDSWKQNDGPWIFPAPPASQREVRPGQFHELLLQRYEQLLKDINAGTPPDVESLAKELEEKDGQFRLHTLSKTAEEALDEHDQKKLTEHLQAYRLQRYEEAASRLSIYADTDAMETPPWDRRHLHELTELYEWQWQFWTFSDVLHALADANADSQSVLQAPVKRLIMISMSSAPSASVAGGASGAQPGGGMAASGGGGMASSGANKGRRNPSGGMASSGNPGFGNTSSNSAPAATGQPINPSAPVPIDYSVSFTGRQSNQLYDVRYVNISIIADTERLPQIIDALAARNFITVLDMSIQPVDPFEHIKQGYMYGDGTVCQANMVLETIWLRQWTSEHMPAELKSIMGIATPPPANAPQG